MRKYSKRTTINREKRGTKASGRKPPPSWRKGLMSFTIGYVLVCISIGGYLYKRGVFTTKHKNVPVSSNIKVNQLSTAHVFNNGFPENMKSQSPCFGPESLVLNNSLSEINFGNLHFSRDDISRIINYFSNIGNGSTNPTVLHIPDWTSRLFKSTNNSDRYINNPSRPPYFLTSVVRLRLYQEDKAKLTMAELKQWIHYQLWAGAEHIYICNHFLHDSERIQPDLQRYIDLGIVTVYPWNKLISIPGSHSYSMDNVLNQDGCYNHVLEHHGNESIWQYNMDMDEYPFVPNDQCEGFFKRYLFNLDRDLQNSDLVSEVKLSNFLMKGQGDRSRDMSIDRINRIDRWKSNGLVKPCYKMEFTRAVGTHGTTLSLGRSNRPSPNDVLMLHYWGSRLQNWGPDTPEMLSDTVEFNAARETLAVNVRHSLLAFLDFQGFNSTTGP